MGRSKKFITGLRSWDEGMLPSRVGSVAANIFGWIGSTAHDRQQASEIFLKACLIEKSIYSGDDESQRGVCDARIERGR